MADRPQRAGNEGNYEEFPIYLSGEDRSYQRLRIGQWGRLVDFAVMQQILMGGKWVDVVRFDCRHGRFHVHRFTRRGHESIKDLGDLDDLGQKYDIAVNELADHWEENRRRYLDG